MAFYPEFKGNPVAARSQAVNIILAKARRELNLPANLIVVRQLRPIDIGLGGGTYLTFAVGTTLSEYSNAAIADNAWISMNGVHLAKGQSMANTGAVSLITGSVEALQLRNEIQRMRIQREGSVTRDWDITAIPAYPSQTGWADDPFTVDQNTNITIQLLATSANTLDGTKHAFLGDVAERKGLTINP